MTWTTEPEVQNQDRYTVVDMYGSYYQPHLTADEAKDLIESLIEGNDGDFVNILLFKGAPISFYVEQTPRITF